MNLSAGRTKRRVQRTVKKPRSLGTTSFSGGNQSAVLTDPLGDPWLLLPVTMGTINPSGTSLQAEVTSITSLILLSNAQIFGHDSAGVG